MRPPSTADIDNDGMLEILVTSRDFHLYCVKPVPVAQYTTTETTTTKKAGKSRHITYRDNNYDYRAEPA